MEQQKKERLEEAKSIYLDVKDFFRTEENLRYFLTVVSKEDALRVLEELQSCFAMLQEFEKCSTIQDWIKRVNIF